MTGLWVFLGAVVVATSIVVVLVARKRRVRSGLRGAGLSERERELLLQIVPLWRRVPAEIRQEAEGWIRLFLAEKSFEACGGLEDVSEEMRLAVAGPACLLIARRPDEYYERLRSILMYPSAYRVRDEWGVEDVRLGESWSTGSVVLAWDTVQAAGRDEGDGLNVVLHEFAHQIDQEEGAADGVPELGDREAYGRWSRVMSSAYESFCERVDSGKRSVLDEYGAENPAEFFAVATETFFERGAALKNEEPEVYEEFRRFYRQDPATW